MTVRARPRVYAAGYSLVEAMIALALSTTVLAALVALLLNAGDGHARQDQAARLQENARAAMQLLRHDLRMAGFGGCASVTDPSFAFIAHDRAVDGSAVLTIRHADPADGPVGDALVLTEHTLPAGILDAGARLELALPRGEPPPDWRPGRTRDFVISDCNHALVLADVEIASIGNDAAELLIDTPVPIDRTLPAGAEVRTLLTSTWYIDNTAGEIDTGLAVPSLFRRTADTAAANYASGIDYLHVQYLTDTERLDEPPPDPARLRAVEIALLARTTASRKPGASPTREYGAEDDTGLAYQLLDRTLIAGDPDSDAPLPSLRGLRQVYSATVTLPNAPSSP